MVANGLRFLIVCVATDCRVTVVAVASCVVARTTAATLLAPAVDVTVDTVLLSNQVAAAAAVAKSSATAILLTQATLCLCSRNLLPLKVSWSLT